MGTGSAPCTCGTGWSRHTSQQESALREICHHANDPLPGRLGHALASHLALRASALYAHQNAQKRLCSPALRLLPAPHLLPGRLSFDRTYPTKVRKNLRRLSVSMPLPTSCHPPLFSVFPSSSPFLPPSHFPFPSQRRVSGYEMQTPLPLCKASGPHPQSKGEWLGVCLPTHFPARMRSSPGCANLGPVSY